MPQGAGSDREVRRCRGSAELIDALDTVLDKNSAIYSFRREQNAAAHNLALALHAECMAPWREGGGPQKQLNLLGKAPWELQMKFLEKKKLQEEKKKHEQELKKMLDDENKKLQEQKKKQEEQQQVLKKMLDDFKEHVARLRGMGINGLPAEELQQLKSAHEEGIRRVQQEIERHEAKSAVASTDKYNCSLTLDLMEDPVVASDGHTYERAAIEKVIEQALASLLARGKTHVEESQRERTHARTHAEREGGEGERENERESVRENRALSQSSPERITPRLGQFPRELATS